MSGELTPTTPADLAGRQARLQSMLLGEPERARTEFLAILDDARAIGSKAQEALALLNLAGCAFLQGRYREMLELSEEALTCSRLARNPHHETRALNSIGLAWQRLGSIDQAMKFFIDSLRLSREVLHDTGLARALANIAIIHTQLAEYDTALMLHEQALEIAQSAGELVGVADLLESILQDHYYLGNYDKALELAVEAVWHPRRHGLSRYECSARSSLGRVLLALGRNRAALRAARAGYRVAWAARDEESMAQLRWIEGQALAGLGDFEGAAEALHESVDRNRDMGNKEHEYGSHLALVQLYESCGNQDKALVHQRKSKELYSQVLDPVATQRAYVLAAQVCDPRTHAAGTLHPWSPDLLDLTRSLKRANTEIAHRLAHDSLTGALTKPHFQLRVQRQLDFLGPDEILGVVRIGVNELSYVRKVFGPSVADSLLAETVARLKDSLRTGDLIGRLANDELALALHYMADAEDMHAILNRCVAVLSEPYVVRGQTLDVTVAVGGAVALLDGDTCDVLLDRCELAMEDAKVAGENTCGVFVAGHMTAADEQRALARDLGGAVERNEFELYYQGIHVAASKSLVGFEALIRWNHPRLGLLGPERFIAMAEDGRHILAIGDWVLRQACAQAKSWNLGQSKLWISVNVSAVQFAQSDFVNVVETALQEHGVPPQALVLELTESMVHDDLEQSRRHLDALRALGVGLALDDFGTGFSSLAMLHEVQVNTLKIDRSFLHGLLPAGKTPDRSLVLLDTVINLASNLDMTVVAEGVETTDQLEVLIARGCHEVQGFLLSKPITAQATADAVGLPVPTGAPQPATPETNSPALRINVDLDHDARVDTGGPTPAG